jgi:hypothetical protein
LKTPFWILVITLYACFAMLLLSLKVLEKRTYALVFDLPFELPVFTEVVKTDNTDNTCIDWTFSPLFRKTVSQTAEGGSMLCFETNFSSRF